MCQPTNALVSVLDEVKVVVRQVNLVAEYENHAPGKIFFLKEVDGERQFLLQVSLLEGDVDIPVGSVLAFQLGEVKKWSDVQKGEKVL